MQYSLPSFKYMGESNVKVVAVEASSDRLTSDGSNTFLPKGKF